jgi:hypothetical protein
MSPRASALLLGVAVMLAGCPAERAPESLETEEVGAPIDAELSFEEDRQAVQRAPTLSGVLPSDFPSDFPLYKPATVVDFGDLGAGRYYVALFSPDPKAKVESYVNAAAPRAGWSLRSASPDAGEFDFRGHGRSVRVRISSAAGGTEMRVEY